ncbi:GNAT family N-acetyltransferase [Arthrobacter sp. H14]|uniref:GNAT family N-acetyltransferase n=1 Tax=Arthrobacter sp. H14 TaxID=1312959 RepID=UPI00047EEDFB|nr:GNAT family N-acetyltransferase [Arthrobacter sp. H14]
MSTPITLAALTGGRDKEPKVAMRPINAADVPTLAELYFNAYVPAAIEGWSPAEASSRLHGLINGGHERPISMASLLAEDTDSQITAAIVVLEGASGDEKEQPAFIAELFIHPEHQRKGLAQELLHSAMNALHAMGRSTIAVTVDSANAAAMALYLSMDFRRWPPQSGENEDWD